MNLFYKNIFPYKLNSKEIKENELQKMLEDKRILPLDETESKNQGWDNYLDSENDLAFKVGTSAYLLKLKIQSKVINSSSVKETLKERIKEIIENGGARPSKKEQKAMIEDIIAVKLPTADIASSYIFGYLDFKNGFLVIDSSSAGKTDAFLEILRNTVDGLELDPISAQEDVSTTLGDWMKASQADDPFDLGDNVKLKDPLGDAKITANKQDLTAEEIKNHLSKGKIVEQLDLVWQKRISFSLNEKFKISKVKFLDIAKEQIKDDLGESDDERAIAQSSLFIMVEDFAELISDLQKIF